MSDVFDNLIISLCKFSTLLGAATGGEGSDQLPISFGENQKAQLAAKALFQLVHNHGDILREGWKNILEVLLQLYKAKMLPKTLTEAEDFVDPKGWISILREPSTKVCTPSFLSLLLIDHLDMYILTAHLYVSASRIYLLAIYLEIAHHVYGFTVK